MKVDIVIDADGTVTSAKGSGAHRMLIEGIGGAEENIRHWVFERANSPRNATFTFVYSLAGVEANFRYPAVVIFDFPDRITITAHPPQVEP